MYELVCMCCSIGRWRWCERVSYYIVVIMSFIVYTFYMFARENASILIHCKWITKWLDDALSILWLLLDVDVLALALSLSLYSRRTEFEKVYPAAQVQRYKEREKEIKTWPLQHFKCNSTNIAIVIHLVVVVCPSLCTICTSNHHHFAAIITAAAAEHTHSHKLQAEKQESTQETKSVFGSFLIL